MTLMAHALRRALFSMPTCEATFARRHFVRGEPAVVAHLERIGQTFLIGYNAAVSQAMPDGFMSRLRSVPLSYLGFAVEGAAMAFVLLDWLAPSPRDRFQRFLKGDAADHPYMAHVGAGWALARLPLTRFARPRQRVLARMDPLLRWLAVDGYGFHQGYFHPRRAVRRQRQPASPASYVCRAFDQGLGRSLWFSECADPWRISLAIKQFPESRRADLWSGVGLSCAYAGGVPDASIATLAWFGRDYAAQIAQGAAFAAKTRLRASNLVDHTTRACRILCQSEPEEAAAVTDVCLVGLSDSPLVPAFESWRQRIAVHFASSARIPQPIA